MKKAGQFGQVRDETSAGNRPARMSPRNFASLSLRPFNSRSDKESVIRLAVGEMDELRDGAGKGLLDRQHQRRRADILALGRPHMTRADAAHGADTVRPHQHLVRPNDDLLAAESETERDRRLGDRSGAVRRGRSAASPTRGRGIQRDSRGRRAPRRQAPRRCDLPGRARSRGASDAITASTTKRTASCRCMKAVAVRRPPTCRTCV